MTLSPNTTSSVELTLGFTTIMASIPAWSMVSVFECRFYQNSEVFEGGLTDLAPPPSFFFSWVNLFSREGRLRPWTRAEQERSQGDLYRQAPSRGDVLFWIRESTVCSSSSPSDILTMCFWEITQFPSQATGTMCFDAAMSTEYH